MSGRTIAVAMLSLALLAPTAFGDVPMLYVKYSQDSTPIPDVNKNPTAPQPDNSCWLASASNILAAAGYGGIGSAQGRAQTIYTQLTMAYGVASGGAPDQAISYWLAWHGKNPASPDYNPALLYTDVTAVYRTLTMADYNFLKSELHRCQYVGVQFHNPAHAMTLVGWDDFTGQSIWQDSDRTKGDGPGGIGDVYTNSFTTTWDLVDPNLQQTYLAQANGYVTLCPGLDKDPMLVANYDVAWAPSPIGPRAREAGVKAGLYGPVPGWQPTFIDPQDPNITYEPFRLNNELDLLRQKHVELLVDYYGRDENYAGEDIRLRYLDQFGQEVIALPDSVALSDDNGQVLFTWILDIQPEWEEILFPSYLEYGLLEGEVASWNVAVICVPEPMSLALLGVGGLAMLKWRRTRVFR